MPFIRRHGKQIELVHGARNRDTKAVEQRVLFTFYSKAEVLDALGDGDPEQDGRLQELIESANPGVRFDWPGIKRALRDSLEHLPDHYEYRGARLEERFDRALVDFARELALADPQWLAPSADLIRDRAQELRFLGELIEWRLEVADSGPSVAMTDNRYLWQTGLPGKQVPLDVAAVAEDLFEKGELGTAEGGFRLLVQAFEEYADGHNYLGLIARERDRLAEAETHFRRAVEVGRRLFPKRFPKSSYWADLRTRPYIRGLIDLTHTLQQVGRHGEALVLCDMLDSEAGREIDANSCRAASYLCTGQWESARRAALLGHILYPEEGFVAAFALFELGRLAEAAGHFLHAALNRPLAARIILGLPSREPQGAEETLDHNAGVHLARTLHGYLTDRRPAQRLFKGLLAEPEVRDAQARVERVARQKADRSGDWAQLTAELSELRKPEFGFRLAEQLDLAGAAARLPRAKRGSPGPRTTSPRPGS